MGIQGRGTRGEKISIVGRHKMMITIINNLAILANVRKESHTCSSIFDQPDCLASRTETQGTHTKHNR